MTKHTLRLPQLLTLLIVSVMLLPHTGQALTVSTPTLLAKGGQDKHGDKDNSKYSSGTNPTNSTTQTTPIPPPTSTTPTSQTPAPSATPTPPAVSNPVTPTIVKTWDNWGTSSTTSTTSGSSTTTNTSTTSSTTSKTTAPATPATTNTKTSTTVSSTTTPTASQSTSVNVNLNTNKAGQNNNPDPVVSIPTPVVTSKKTVIPPIVAIQPAKPAAPVMPTPAQLNSQKQPTLKVATVETPSKDTSISVPPEFYNLLMASPVSSYNYSITNLSKSQRNRLYSIGAILALTGIVLALNKKEQEHAYEFQQTN